MVSKQRKRKSSALGLGVKAAARPRQITQHISSRGQSARLVWPKNSAISIYFIFSPEYNSMMKYLTRKEIYRNWLLLVRLRLRWDASRKRQYLKACIKLTNNIGRRPKQ